MKTAFGWFWLVVSVALFLMVGFIIWPSISLWQEAVTRVSKPTPPAPEKAAMAPESSLPIGAMGGPAKGPQPSEVSEAIARLEKALGETKKAGEPPKEPPPEPPPKKEEAKKPSGKKVSAMPMSSASALERSLRAVFESQQRHQHMQFEAYLAQKKHLATEKLKRELWVWKSEVVRSQPSGQGKVSFRVLVTNPDPERQREYKEELEKLEESIEAERIAFGHRLSLDYALFERQLQLMRQAQQRPQGARLY